MDWVEYLDLMEDLYVQQRTLIAIDFFPYILLPCQLRYTVTHCSQCFYLPVNLYGERETSIPHIPFWSRVVVVILGLLGSSLGSAHH